jgi:hypothetical protein
MATYYIDTTGNDITGTGAVGSPWKTLYRGCVSTLVSGSIIHLNAGTYVENTQSVLAKGVSIVGDGSTSSIIKSIVTGAWETAALISLTSGTNNVSGNQYITGIGFDGSSGTGFTGIYIEALSDVSIYNCSFTNFEKNAVTFNGMVGTVGDDQPDPSIWSTGNSFHDNTITNCARLYDDVDHYSYFTGSLQIGQQDGMQIYNNVITETTKPAGQCAYCIKMFNAGYNRGLKIYDNKLYKKAASTYWFDWNFAIELWNYRGGIEIYNNYIQGSIDTDHIERGDPAKGYTYSIDIHDNSFGYTSLQTSSGANLMAGIYIEFMVDGSFYIRNNTFNNLECPIRFSPRGISDPNPNAKGHNLEGIYIYNNVFNGIGNAGADGNGRLIDWASQYGVYDVSNLQFYHNTAYVNSGGAYNGLSLFANNVFGHASNINIKNNIFQGFDPGNPVVYQIDAGEGIDNLHIDNNIFYLNGSDTVLQDGAAATNYTANNNLVKNPSFNTLGSDFHLLSNSAAINNGTYITLVATDKDGVVRANPPEIGAYEYGTGGGSTSAPVKAFIYNNKLLRVNNKMIRN